MKGPRAHKWLCRYHHSSYRIKTSWTLSHTSRLGVGTCLAHFSQHTMFSFFSASFYVFINCNDRPFMLLGFIRVLAFFFIFITELFWIWAREKMLRSFLILLNHFTLVRFPTCSPFHISFILKMLLVLVTSNLYIIQVPWKLIFMPLITKWIFLFL